ncbi:PEP-utilizing enzyme [Tardiphaga sp. 172_B4_N1_3]|uniref:PEP-utilizing enzyme n=1 Tax=Tardiphaga sp. 172_B4_N1_3 TaxID=3240787 RepID=UPI003F8C090A
MKVDQGDVDSYRALTAVDDLAFSALKISLSEPERSVVVDRLRDDWMTDVGVIGMLRRIHVQSRSIEEPALAYWISRREPLSPRIESLLSSFLINLASSMVYDTLKEFANAGYDISKLLSIRGGDLGSAVGFVEQINTLLLHVRTFIAIFRAKQDSARHEEIRNVVQGVLNGRKIEFDSVEAGSAVEILMKNLAPAIRGVISEELKKQRVFVDTPANGVLTEGIGAAPGVGCGPPARWDEIRVSAERTPHVLFIVESGLRIKSSLLVLVEEAAAVVTWNSSMTSHIPIACRGVGRPAIIVSEEEAKMLLRRKFLIVDGTAGLVRSFHRRPKNLLAPY